jgi:hypothetical protein
MTMIVDPSQPYQVFNIELEKKTVKIIEVSMKKGNILRIYGKVTSQSVTAGPKAYIHLVREVDRPPETLAPDRQRKILRQKAFLTKKVSGTFETEYTAEGTEPLLLVIDNNHRIATRSVNITIQILGKEYEKESKQPAPTIPVTDKTIKRILGVMKSFQTINMKELTTYSGLDINETRNIVFELIAEDQVTGRFHFCICGISLKGD